MKKLVIFLCMLICASVRCFYNVNAESECVFLTTVMYHNILNSKTGTYIISETQLDNDLYCYKKLGYNFVSPSEVISYAEGKTKLPQKPLLITFDDGHYNNLYYGLPLLIKHNAKACFNIIGKFSETSSTNGDDSNPNYSHLTWAQIRTLSKSNLVEIGSHTYNMHNYSPRFGVGQIHGESDIDYRNALKKDIAQITNKLYDCTGKRPVTFAYPFGKYSDIAKEELLKSGYKMMLTCNEGISKIYFGDPKSIYYIKRYNRSGLISTQEFTQKLQTAYNKVVS